MEREGEVRGREGKEMRGRRGVEMRRGRGIIVGGIAFLLVLGCNNGGNGGIAELEKKSSFYESIMKIGQGFQEIFGIFGNAMGDAFGIVKSSDNKSEVGKHFDKVKKGLENTKNKLGELSGKISESKNVDSKRVEAIINSASEVIVELMNSVNKLAEVTKEGSSMPVGDVDTSSKAIGAHKESIDTIIKEIRSIIKTAKESGVEIDDGKPGSAIAYGDDKAGAALVGKNSGGAKPTANVGPLLASEIVKADPWAMIGKIKDAKTDTAKLAADNANDAGVLATKVPDSANQNGAATNADLAAAVALKAMTKGGKFSANSAGEEEAGAVKAAAANAVNKVLGVLDEIIRRTVAKNLEKLREAVKGIQYSETSGEVTESK